VRSPVAEEGSDRVGLRRWVTPSSVLLVVPVLFLLGLYLYPILVMLGRSVTDPELGLQNYEAITQAEVYRRVLWTTLRISIMVTLVSLLLGYPTAYLLSHARGRARRLLMLGIILPFWTSVLVRSFSWMILLGEGGMIAGLIRSIPGLGATRTLYSTFAVVLAMVHVLMPFMVLTLKSTMDQIDDNLTRAAETMGATPPRAFLTVYLPQTVPGIVSGCLLVFVIALGFYITPALLGGPGQTMISVLIERLVGATFQWGVAAALATVLLVVSFALYAIVKRFVRVEGLMR
jgi:ABC-type spermidine/putrescine transport system permease subunit I